MRIFRTKIWKTLTAATACSLAGMSLLIPAANAEENLVPDKALANCVRYAAGLRSNAIPITREHLEQITNLVCGEAKVQDLTGLELATNLNKINIAKNNITSLAPLAGLTKLESLTAFENPISDITPLSNLTKLSVLSLGATNITSISALENLTDLTRLYIYRTQVADLSPVAGMTKLQTLSAYRSAVNSLEPVRSLTTLSTLDISNTKVKDLEPITNLTNLQVLSAHSNSLTSLAPLENLTALTELYLSNTGSKDITPLRNLHNLTKLNVATNHIHDLQALAQHPNRSSYTLYPQIRVLRIELPKYTQGLQVNFTLDALNGTLITPEGEEISPKSDDPYTLLNNNIVTQSGDSYTVTFNNENDYNTVSKYSYSFAVNTHFRIALAAKNLVPDPALANCVRYAAGLRSNTIPITREHLEQITELVCGQAKVQDLTGLELATNLSKINIAKNNVTSLAPLAGLTKLDTLIAFDNPISDITPLSELTGLSELSLGGSNIDSIAPLQKLVNLTKLNIYRTKVSDLSPVAGMTKLQTLSAYRSAVNSLEPVRSLTKLSTLDISNTKVEDLEPITNLTNLKVLSAHSNSISDLTPLKNLTSLSELYLQNSAIKDISALENLTNLTKLNVYNNYVRDFRPLAQHANRDSYRLYRQIVLLPINLPDYSPGLRVDFNLADLAKEVVFAPDGSQIPVLQNAYTMIKEPIVIKSGDTYTVTFNNENDYDKVNESSYNFTQNDYFTIAITKKTTTEPEPEPGDGSGSQPVTPQPDPGTSPDPTPNPGTDETEPDSGGSNPAPNPGGGSQPDSGGSDNTTPGTGGSQPKPDPGTGSNPKPNPGTGGTEPDVPDNSGGESPKPKPDGSGESSTPVTPQPNPGSGSGSKPGDGGVKPNPPEVKPCEMPGRPGVLAGGPRFKDTLAYPFAREIDCFALSGITTGYADGSFRPHDSVSRAAMAAFLYRLEGKPAYNAPAKSPFRDIKPGDDFYKEICWLASKGITTGYADGTFKPWDPIARDAMAAFLHRYDSKVAAKKLPVKLAAKKFTDTAATPFAKDIAWLSQTGVTTGYADGSFRPFENIERGAIAAFFYRMKH